ncbi:hypothetical protein RQP53_05350 [Paucibacter sp. APW11]|uniref:Uncharacterized protein n=1 Tax=Roseateles aquae TaxID=3077235 RepID=A0ABU3P8R6_9BURK|nr:hypothetical protein [Paucibacter sp. APW11]MDT8998692.1 hypothetical protein [Paucibacter sp. APW11]
MDKKVLLDLQEAIGMLQLRALVHEQVLAHVVRSVGSASAVATYLKDQRLQMTGDGTSSEPWDTLIDLLEKPPKGGVE